MAVFREHVRSGKSRKFEYQSLKELYGPSWMLKYKFAVSNNKLRICRDFKLPYLYDTILIEETQWGFRVMGFTEYTKILKHIKHFDYGLGKRAREMQKRSGLFL